VCVCVRECECVCAHVYECMIVLCWLGHSVIKL
jgi:hypothetical protein